MSRRPGLARVPLGTPPAQVTGRFVALVPGERAPLCAFDLPGGVTGPARLRIARQQIADRLGPGAARPEIHPVGPAAWTRAVVVAPEAAAAWRADPLAADRRCAGLWPDYMALPAAEALVVLDAADGRVRARVGLDDGFSAPVALAGPLLRAAIAEQRLERAQILRDEGLEPALAVLRAAGISVETDAEQAETGPEAAGGVFDLRRDPGQAGDRIVREMALWALPAMLGLLALGLWSAATLTETRALRAETAAMRAATEARLREGLIPDGPILDIRAQVAQVRAGRGATGAPGPMALLRRAAGPLAASADDIDAVALEPGGALSVTLLAPDFETLDALARELAAAGLAAETASARATEAGVEARLTLTEGAG